MRLIPVLLLMVFAVSVLATDEEDLPPIFAGEDETDDAELEGEFDLAELFGEGLTFIGRLDIWAR
ncbi:hypothetical protein KAU45_05525, partial [bacterium]|nr:hypothetical protein [bacterium]